MVFFNLSVQNIVIALNIDRDGIDLGTAAFTILQPALDGISAAQLGGLSNSVGAGHF